MTDVVDLLAWNPHTGATAKHVTAVLTAQVEERRPDYLGLFEVGGKQQSLARWAVDHGYRIMQEDARPEVPGRPKPEHGNTALLVTRRRDDMEHLGDRTVAMRAPWEVMSKNRLHAPRRYEQSRDRLPGGPWKVRAFHGPTNGFHGGNRAAFIESMARAAYMLRSGTGRCADIEAEVLPKFESDHHMLRYRLTRKGKGTIPVVFGDINEKVDELEPWAKRLGCRVVGHNVDALISR